MKYQVSTLPLVNRIKGFLEANRVKHDFTETEDSYQFQEFNDTRHVYRIESRYHMYSKHSGYNREIDSFGKCGFTIAKTEDQVLFDSIFDYQGCNVSALSLDSMLFSGRKETRGDLINHGFVIPEYQRPLVWDLGDQVKLIDTLLMGYPIGMFIFNKTHTEDFAESRVSVIDGQQRLNAITLFMDGKITDSKNRTYQEISSIEKSRFNDVQNSVVMFKDLPLEKEVQAYLSAIVTGVRHNSEEISKAVSFLAELQAGSEK